MTQKELSELSDQELSIEAKKMKSASITSALLIGFMFGVVAWGVAKNNLGFLTLIPLFFAYKFFNNPKNKEYNNALTKLLKERNLK